MSITDKFVGAYESARNKRQKRQIKKELKGLSSRFTASAFASNKIGVEDIEEEARRIDLTPAEVASYIFITSFEDITAKVTGNHEALSKEERFDRETKIGLMESLSWFNPLNAGVNKRDMKVLKNNPKRYGEYLEDIITRYGIREKNMGLLVELADAYLGQDEKQAAKDVREMISKRISWAEEMRKECHKTVVGKGMSKKELIDADKQFIRRIVEQDKQIEKEREAILKEEFKKWKKHV